MARQLAALVLGWMAWGAGSNAATLTWDANPAAAGAQDGSGQWDAATANWFNGAADVLWPNTTDTAVFGAGTVGTYTVTVGTVNAGALSFAQGGYTLTGGTLTLNPANLSAGFTAVTSGGGTTTLASTLAGTAGTRFTKTGPGTLAITSLTGGTATSPTIATVTGGTYSGATGAFDSVLSMPFANTFGTAPTAPAIQILLDAGTLQFTGGGGQATLGANRTIKVSSAGGALLDAGGKLDGQVLDNAGSNTSFYISTPANATSTFEGSAVISGPGGVTLNGLGTTIFQGANVYTGPTAVNKGTLQLAAGTPGLTGGSLGNNNVTVASGATLSLQGGSLLFNLSISSDRLAIQGNLTTGGVNYVRLGLGNLPGLTPGTYPLVSAAGSLNLAGTYQLDGGASLSVPATSVITQFGGTTITDGNGSSTGGVSGGTFYRLTPQAAGTGAQYVVAAAPANVINVMPLGSSITEGVSYGGQTPAYSGGGYRSQLYQMLVNDGRFSPNFEGSNTVLDNATPSGYNVLTGANQLHHEGHGGYQTTFVLNKLNANTIFPNDGGYWLASANNGVNPDYVTLSTGGNDFGADGTQTTQPLNRLDAILTYIQQLRPASNVLVANLFYRNQQAGTTSLNVGDLQNKYYNPLLPSVVFNHLLAGHHVTFVDQFDAVTPNNSVTGVIGPDGIHPLIAGYQLMAPTWYNAIASGSAYWTGAQGDGKWSTVTAGGGTNFAQNYQLTTPYNTAPGALTDVYFNGNTAPLATALGRDLTVRSVNFAVGASGPVTIGGANTLTIGASPAGSTFAGVGGITVQSGSGAHTISANVVLGGPQSVSVNNNQVWGNVSSSNFTVTGNISGNYGLTLTNSYTVYAPTPGTANGSDTTGSVVTQTGSGTGQFILSGNNTYSGGTVMSGGTMVVNNATGSGTGTGPVTVGKSATLVNNGGISGDVTVGGAASGSGTFAGSVTVNNGGTFDGAATVNGPLTVNAGGAVALSSGTLTANGGVVNNGTIRLDHGAALAVSSAPSAANRALGSQGAARPARGAASAANGGAAFINNGTLDIISGGFSAPAGFTNNGVVIDSRVVRVKNVSMADHTVTLSVDGYTGHNYQLQRSDSLAGGTFVNLGRPQSGTTGAILTLQDAGTSSVRGFYRVQVDP